MVLKYSSELFFLKCILEFMINTAPQGSKSVNSRERYFKNVNFREAPTQWLHGLVIKAYTLFAAGNWNAGSNPGVTSSNFFFLSSFFYLLAFYCLFSLLTLLASRDFCENVFLVLDSDQFERQTKHPDRSLAVKFQAK